MTTTNLTGEQILSMKDPDVAGTRKANEIGKSIMALTDELGILNAELQGLPREVLIASAVGAIARYYDSAEWPVTAEDKRILEREKDLRLSWLTEDERVVADNQAGDWLRTHS